MRSLIHIASVGSLLTFLLLVFYSASAQTGSVKGVIKDADGKPVQYANVLLLKAFDSSLVKGTVSDAPGNYSFENIEKGKYYITASFTGMDLGFTKVFEIISNDKNQIDLEVLYLHNT